MVCGICFFKINIIYAIYFGIEIEADLYCTSSKIGLASDLKAINVIDYLEEVYIEEDRVNMSLDEISDFIVLLCNENALHQITDRDDEQGVAWTIALLAKAYIAVSRRVMSYDELFKRSFIKYYDNDIHNEENDDHLEKDVGCFSFDKNDDSADCPPKSQILYTYGKLTCPYCGEIGQTFVDGTAYCRNCRRWYCYS